MGDEKEMTKDRTLICFPKLLSYYVCDAKIVFISRQAQGKGSKDERGLNVNSVRGHLSKIQNRNLLDQ